MGKSLIFRYAFFLLLSSGYSFNAVAAEPYHVSDEVKIFMHRGPSNQYKIKARISSGEALTLLGRDNDTKYVHVRTNSGLQGWIEERYLESGLSVKARLPELEQLLLTGQELQAKQASEIDMLSAELKRVNRQRVTELADINEGRAKATAQVAQLENQIARMQAEIDGMDQSNLMGWFIRGGAVAIVGIIIGLIIPNLPKRRRRTDDWF